MITFNSWNLKNILYILKDKNLSRLQYRDVAVKIERSVSKGRN